MSDGKDDSCGDTKKFQPKELYPCSTSYIDRVEKRNLIQSGKLGGPGEGGHSVLPIEQAPAPLSLKPWFGLRCDDGALRDL